MAGNWQLLDFILDVELGQALVWAQVPGLLTELLHVLGLWDFHAGHNFVVGLLVDAFCAVHS